MTDPTILATNLNLIKRSIGRNLHHYPKIQAVITKPQDFARVLRNLDESQLGKAMMYLDEFKSSLSTDVVEIGQIPKKATRIEHVLNSIISDANSNPEKVSVIYA